MTLIDVPPGLAERLDPETSPVEAVLAEGLRLRQLADEVGMEPGDLLAALESSLLVDGLTVAEAGAFADAGIDLSGPADDPSGVGAVVTGLAADHTLVSEGLTVEQAASELGVTAARVRQRIGRGDLITIRRTDGHVLPRWQFAQGRLVPELAVACAPGSGLHPLELARFMTRPSIDLVIDDESVSPRDWLLLGGEPSVVAELLDSVVRG
jgi:hypothetical protein